MAMPVQKDQSLLYQNHDGKDIANVRALGTLSNLCDQDVILVIPLSTLT